MSDAKAIYAEICRIVDRDAADGQGAQETMDNVLGRLAEFAEESDDLEPTAINSRLQAEIDRLRRDCSEAYQAAGALADKLGWWMKAPEHPWHTPILKLLDNLHAAAVGTKRPHDDLLPFVLKEPAND